nr:DNA-binding transcriptional regulator [uncultured Enterobacter sp.]
MPSRNNEVFRVALMLKAKGRYGRSIIEGICEYMKSTRLQWDFLLEEDFRSSPASLLEWKGDGIIADYDDPNLKLLLAKVAMPVVGIGGTYQMNHPAIRAVPYVASDNSALVKLAYHHLIDMGLPRFACYSIESTVMNPWAVERASAFRRLVEADGFRAEIYEGVPTHALVWQDILENLKIWLHTLEKPVGIIAVTDSRARQVLQACLLAGYAVPEEVAIIGIDDDPLLRGLSRIPLSSVAQGTHQMGRAAAEILHFQIMGMTPREKHVIVRPEGVNSQASTLHSPVMNSYITRARHFIRQFGSQGIKAAQVAEHVGCSRATLDMHFMRIVGNTLHDELLRFRLERSKSLLTQTDLSYCDVALQCGFTSLQYMYAVYRREMGCTPVEYRRNGDTNGKEDMPVWLKSAIAR